MALSLVFGMSQAAAAQDRGPPAASAASGLDADVSQSGLTLRLQTLQQKLTGRTDNASIQMLSQVRALLAKLRSQPSMSAPDLNAMDETVEKIEAVVG